MNGWPQMLVIAWLVLSVVSSLAFAARGVRGWLTFTPRHQRLGALAFAAAGISEASLLWAGGFFKGVF